jgi:hypothetical protein
MKLLRGLVLLMIGMAAMFSAQFLLDPISRNMMRSG